MRKQKVQSDLAQHFKVYVQLVLIYYDENKEPYVQRRFVTSINHSPKVFMYELGKKALDFGTIDNAMEYCIAFGVNGYTAYPVLMPNWNRDFCHRNQYQEFMYESALIEYNEDGTKKENEK